LYAAISEVAISGDRAPDGDSQSLAGQSGDLPREAIGLVVFDVQGHRRRRPEK